MQYARPVGAGILFGIAVLTGVIALIGAVGVWFVRAQVNQTAAAGTALLTGYLDIAGQTVGSIDERLAEAQQQAESLRGRVAQLRESVSTEPAVQELQHTLDAGLAPSLERAADGTGQLHAGLQAYERNVERLNQLPFVSLPRMSDRLDPLLARGAELRDQASSVKAAIGKFDGIRLGAIVDEALAQIAGVRLTLARVDEAVEAAKTALVRLQEAVSYWTTVAAAVLTPLLAFFAVGQASLAARAWRWMHTERGKPARVQPE